MWVLFIVINIFLYYIATNSILRSIPLFVYKNNNAFVPKLGLTSEKNVLTNGKKTNIDSISFDLQKEIYNWAINLPNTNIVKRHCYTNHIELYQDKLILLNNVCFQLPKPVRCYGCNKPYTKCHPVYVFSCKICGNAWNKLRHLSRDLTGKKCLVIGARTKLGHQIVVKLLDAGATVIGTSRFPEKALDNYQQYPHWNKWQANLYFYPFSLDLDTPNIAINVVELKTYLLQTIGHLDILINCAAQTIRCREKKSTISPLGKISSGTNLVETNRYGDSKFVACEQINSWNMELVDLQQNEMEEVFRINAIAPTLIIQHCMQLLQKSSNNPYIINVHAREGLFCVDKTSKHIHTNMAKAGLAMLTKCLKSCRYHTLNGKTIWIHGIDPGWISIDEYYESERPFIVPPLDEVDGAARILYPVMANMSGSYMKTRRHYHNFNF